MRRIAFPIETPILKTKRLLLRELKNSDDEDYFALCTEEQTMRAYGIRGHKDRAETKQTIEFLRSEFKAQRMLRFGLFLNEREKLIGDCGFWQFDHRRLRAELGAKISVAYARQGFMSEAFRALIEFAFAHMNLHALEANIAVDNLASHRLVESVGFIKEGSRREFTYCAYDDRFKDSSLFTLLKNDVRSANE